LEAKTPYGQTALYLSAMNGHEDIVRYLLDKGANTNVRDTFYKAPMLGFVLQRKHREVAKLLVSKSTNLDQDLGDVADTGRADLVQAVLARGKLGRPAERGWDARIPAFRSRRCGGARVLCRHLQVRPDSG
jgi:ankyrin repeat protein